ncbi:MAG: hypothetical protein FJY17_01355 [Bacteroidetes bacterium]|nr:hypothetical protein [Bacteroidota bacterium]
MKLFYAFIFAHIGFQSWSQTLESELSKSYSKEEIAQFKEANALPLYEYALTHACYLIDKPQGKDVSGFPVVKVNGETIPLNFTYYQIQLADRTQYFQIEGSSRILVVKSKNVLSLEMQNQKK